MGLTRQQKEQIIPILNDEIKQLGTLKTNTVLSGPEKIEELRQIGVTFDEKVNPLLNADQQPKFEALREAMRVRVLEKITSGVGAKLKGDAEEGADRMKQDLEKIKEELKKAWL